MGFMQKIFVKFECHMTMYQKTTIGLLVLICILLLILVDFQLSSNKNEVTPIVEADRVTTSVPYLTDPTSNKQRSKDSDSFGCDKSAWDHVYNPSRLKIIEDCITVTGIVEKIRKEKDGDIHIVIRLDNGQENLLNTINNTQQDSCLILEIIHVYPATEPNSAIQSKRDYINQVTIPQQGDHIYATGSYVKDLNNGWMEIHPVSSIIVDQTKFPARSNESQNSYGQTINKNTNPSQSARIGAICNDGTKSTATGRGACSHHGGVKEWIYE